MHITLTSQWWCIWEWLFLLLVEIGTIGFVIGSTNFGLNLFLTCCFCRVNYNDAFSAFRMNKYNNFLRLRIQDDHVEVYSIGLEDVPKRAAWARNPKRAIGNPNEPLFVPTRKLCPHLIEKVTI